MWNWTSCAGCQSCRRRRSTRICCSWSGTFQSGWWCHRAQCAAAGCFWTWPAALLTLSWSLGCCLFSVSCRKVCSRVCRWGSSHGPQVSLLMDGKCQFRSSHGGPVYVQRLSPALLLVLDSQYYPLAIYTHPHRKKYKLLSSIILIYSDVLSGKMLFVRIMDCNNSTFARDCFMP